MFQLRLSGVNLSIGLNWATLISRAAQSDPLSPILYSQRLPEMPRPSHIVRFAHHEITRIDVTLLATSGLRELPRCGEHRKQNRTNEGLRRNTIVVVGEQKRTRTWVVLAFGDERQHAGNAGYDDEPKERYSYDSYVANHLQAAVGHRMILCDRARALGIARVETLDSTASTRALQRCPVCQTTGIKLRRTKKPDFRCHEGHEFQAPCIEHAPCIKYTALFGGTFAAFDECFGRDFLRLGCPRYSDQLAIQEFDFLRMESEFRSRFPKSAAVVHGLSLSSTFPGGSNLR
jgi:hypothetical protein